MFVLAANIPIKIIYKFQLFHSKHLHTKIKLMKPIKMKIKYSASEHCTANRKQIQYSFTSENFNKGTSSFTAIFYISYTVSRYIIKMFVHFPHHGNMSFITFDGMSRELEWSFCKKIFLKTTTYISLL